MAFDEIVNEWVDDSDMEFAGGWADHKVVVLVPADRVEHPDVQQLIEEMEDVFSTRDPETGLVKIVGFITTEFETEDEIDEFNEWLDELVEDAKRAGADVTVW